jgi:hypothetical protein
MASWEFSGLDEAIAEADQVLDLRHDIDEALLGHDVGGLELEQQYESARDTGKVVPVAERTLDAAKAYAEADDDLDDGSGVLGAIGLVGSGADDKLDTARKELKQGHPAASLAASRAVEKRVRDAKRNGALRAGAVGVVLLVALFGWWRLRRWRRRRGDARVAKAVAALEEGSTPRSEPDPSTEPTESADSAESTNPADSTPPSRSRGFVTLGSFSDSAGKPDSDADATTEEPTDAPDAGRRRLRRRRPEPTAPSTAPSAAPSADSTPPSRPSRSSGFVTLGSFSDSATKPPTKPPTDAPDTSRRRLRRRRPDPAAPSADSTPPSRSEPTTSTSASGLVRLGSFGDSAGKPDKPKRAAKADRPRDTNELSIPTSRFRRRRRQAEIVDPADIFGEGPTRDQDDTSTDEGDKPPDRTW